MDSIPGTPHTSTPQPGAGSNPADTPPKAISSEAFTVAGLEPSDLLAESLSPSDVLLSHIAGSERRQNVSSATVREDLNATPLLINAYRPDSIHEVGRGGMSVIFGAMHEELGTIHAIKVMTRPVTDRALSQFQEEARRLARLDHPNIIRVHQAGKTDSGRPFFVMTFVPGGKTLKDTIHDYHYSHAGKVLPQEWRRRPQPLLDIVTTVLGALNDVHNADIVHRDIKPTNILVVQPSAVGKHSGTTPGHVFLADFGLSTNANEVTSGATPKPFEGTPQYAAPEQVDHTVGSISRATDVYQMGLILWEALTNQAPFEGERRLDVVLSKIAKAKSPRELYGDILSFKADLPPELVAIVYKALARNPHERYQTTAEFRNDLLAFKDREQVSAYQDSLPLAHSALYQIQLMSRSSALWVRGHKAISAGLVASTLFIGGTLEGQRRERVRETEEQIANVRLAELNRRAEDALRKSREATERGDLEIAQGQVPIELVESLRKEGDHKSRTLAQAIEIEREERQLLLDLRKSAVQGYLAAVQSLNPNELGRFDYEQLEQALHIYLPGGLTDKGIAALKSRFSRSSLALSEKIEILDMLTELSTMFFLRDFDLKIPLPSDRYQLALEHLARIGSLADACNIRIGDKLVRSVIPPDFTIILRQTNGETPTAGSRRSSVALRTDSFFQALYNNPEPHAAWSDPGVADMVKYCAVALRRIEEARPSNVGASIFAAALELRDPSPESKVRALQSTLNAVKAARQVGVDNVYLQGRAILLAGDIAGRLRAEFGGDTDRSTGSEPLLIQAQRLALDLLAPNAHDVDPKLLAAHCRIARQLPSEPAPEAIARLCQAPAFEREGELAKAWYEMRQRGDNPDKELDKPLCLRVAMNPINQREEPWVAIELFDALKEYDDAVAVMRNHAARFPAFKDKLGHILPNPIGARDTLRERREAILDVIRGR